MTQMYYIIQNQKMKFLFEENDKLNQDKQTTLSRFNTLRNENFEMSRRQSQMTPQQETRIRSLVSDLEDKVTKLILENESLNDELGQKKSIHNMEENSETSELSKQELELQMKEQIKLKTILENNFKVQEQVQQKISVLQKQVDSQTLLINSYKEENMKLQQALLNKN